jgi:SAM-dependent methyltransferase
MISEYQLTTKRKIKLKILSYFLKGNNVECPVCSKRYITFLPFGLKYKRANALCINCFSLERHRLIWLFLKQKTKLFTAPQKIRMLHVAPEACYYDSFYRNPQIEYYPVDLFEEGYTYPKGTINMDITKMQFSNNFFDVIICNHVLEHIPDDKLAMKELQRVLHKDGWAIIQVPIEKGLQMTIEDPTVTDPAEREKLFGQEDHVRQYGLDFTERLISTGFFVNVDKLNDSFSRKEKFKYGLPKNTDIYYCTKKSQTSLKSI